MEGASSGMFCLPMHLHPPPPKWPKQSKVDTKHSLYNLSLISFPVGQKKNLDVAGQKLSNILSLNCLSITLTAGVILKEEKCRLLSCGGTVWEGFQETIWARIIASQKLSQDSGETTFALRDIKVSRRALIFLGWHAERSCGSISYFG